MLFSRSFVLAVSALPFLVAATPIDLAPRGGPSTCNTGPVQCCNTVTSASSGDATKILGLLGIVLQDLNVLVGLHCTPIDIVTILNGGTCDSEAVCCQDNSHGSLVSIGCLPVKL